MSYLSIFGEKLVVFLCDFLRQASDGFFQLRHRHYVVRAVRVQLTWKL